MSMLSEAGRKTAPAVRCKLTAVSGSVQAGHPAFPRRTASGQTVNADYVEKLENLQSDSVAGKPRDDRACLEIVVGVQRR